MEKANDELRMLICLKIYCIIKTVIINYESWFDTQACSKLLPIKIKDFNQSKHRTFLLFQKSIK